MYRNRQKYSEKLARMRLAKERRRLELEAPEYDAVFPDLRRKIIVIDYDFGEVRHEIDLYRTNRRDCYRAVADGKLWHLSIGWSRILEGLRKSLPRVSS